MILQSCDIHEDFMPVFADDIDCPACAIEARLLQEKERTSGLEQEIRDMLKSLE